MARLPDVTASAIGILSHSPKTFLKGEAGPQARLAEGNYCNTGQKLWRGRAEERPLICRSVEREPGLGGWEVGGCGGFLGLANSPHLKKGISTQTKLTVPEPAVVPGSKT